VWYSEQGGGVDDLVSLIDIYPQKQFQPDSISSTHDTPPSPITSSLKQ